MSQNNRFRRFIKDILTHTPFLKMLLLLIVLWLVFSAGLYAVESGTEAEISALDGLKAVAMGMAAHKSIEEKRPVDMSEFGL